MIGTRNGARRKIRSPLLLACIFTPFAGLSFPASVAAQNPVPVTASAVRNFLTITDEGNDRIMWNGGSVNKATLTALLAQCKRMPVEPELVVVPNMEARLELIKSVMQIVKQSGVSRFGSLQPAPR